MTFPLNDYTIDLEAARGAVLAYRLPVYFDGGASPTALLTCDLAGIAATVETLNTGTDDAYSVVTLRAEDEATAGWTPGLYVYTLDVEDSTGSVWRFAHGTVLVPGLEL